MHLGAKIAMCLIGVGCLQGAISQNVIGIVTPLRMERCVGASVDVVAKSASEIELACSASLSAIRLLRQCNIATSRPVVVELVRDPRHKSLGITFGLFDSEAGRVYAGDVASVRALAAGSPYHGLPLLDFHKSVIVHEVVHAILHEHYIKKPVNRAAYEYPAYALQISSLPLEFRKRFLAIIDEAPLRRDYLFTDIVLAMNPYIFAARAYQHFSATSDGCKIITDLLNGNVDFVAGLE